MKAGPVTAVCAMPQCLRTVSQLLAFPGSCETSFGTQKLPRETTAATVSQSADSGTTATGGGRPGQLPPEP